MTPPNPASPSAVDYVVVGADVDEVSHYLHSDGSISDQPAAGAEPLDVEFIGRLMVRLSKAGPGGADAAALAAHADAIRHALRVRDMPGANGLELTEAQRAAILAATEVRIVFEERTPGTDGTDRNVRVLVVPSDRTLEIRELELDGTEPGPGILPPLTYDLDQALMLVSLSDEIHKMVASFGAKGEPGWTPALEAALQAHVTEEIEALTRFPDGPGGPDNNPRNAVLKSRKRAFHRSVGIYATNMCR